MTVIFKRFSFENARNTRQVFLRIFSIETFKSGRPLGRQLSKLFRACSFSLIFFAFILILSGCFDTHQPAPVVNAWYQSRASASDYVVREGETIYSIAWAFGLDYRALVSVNHLSPPYALTPGQRLEMTTTPVGEKSAAKPRTRLFRGLRTTSTAPATTEIKQPVLHHHYFSHHWQWPTKGRVTQGFSTNPSGHPGISISGKFDSPVRAAADGIVVYSGDGVRGYGNLIIIKHNNSYLSAYGYNERNLVSVGQPVRSGTEIARMGKNDAGRTMLYFEIRRDGVPVNPERLLVFSEPRA